METNVLFTEKQRFTQWWLWLIIAVVNLSVAYGAYLQFTTAIDPAGRPMDLVGFYIGLGLILLMDLLFVLARLETQISKAGIQVRLFPFHLKAKFFPWSEIAQSEVRTYQPLSEFGGWGLKWSLSGKGKAYNVAGNQGLQLQFSDGRRLLIGTQQQQEIQAVLQAMGKVS